MLAALYIVTGKLGLLFALPAGFVTILWPPSGIALGMLLVYGWRLWPGVLVGSLLLNLSNAGLPGDFSLQQALTLSHALTSAAIAVGATLQALAGRALIARYVGLPLHFNHLREMGALIALGGPLAGLIAASVGVGALWLSGILSTEDVAGNWLVWWLGDVIGVVVFLPLVLIWPGEKNRMTWRGTAVRSLPVVAMAVLMVPLGLTFYTWKVAGEISANQAEAQFVSLAGEHEKALLHRLDSYRNALLGGAGFFQGSTSVSREGWRRYVQALRVQTNFPGVNGIGWIEAVAPAAVPEFLRRVREDGAPQFQIRPSADISPLYVITYIEPVEGNEPAVGLNIAFEPHRLEAANLSRDSGKPAITRRIVLVQDQQQTAGFLLLHPIYQQGAALATAAERRAALKGWIYAPFVAMNLFKDLSAGSGRTHTLKIYDGDEERPEALIYSDGAERSSAPMFTVRKHLKIMQQQWLVVWESAPAFERREQTSAPLYILIGGLLFTTLFALFLVGMTLHRTETIEWMAGEGKYALSVGVFVLLAVGSYTAFRSLEQAELGHVRERVQDEVSKVGLLLNSQVNDRMLSLKRMAQRWHASGGTPQPMWQADARNYIRQLGGLKSLEWVDATYRIRWVEPLAGNERLVGLDVLRGDDSIGLTDHAPNKDKASVTPPLDLGQGYMAFLAYQPVTVGERFDGFLVGVFGIDDFFRSAISAETGDSYALAVTYAGKTYFSNGVPENLQEPEWGIEQGFLLNDKQWVLRLVPTREFIASQRSALPIAVLIAGMLIAVLSAVSLRYILMSRLKSARLAESSSLNSAILASTPYLVVATDQQGKIITFNQAAENALGYTADEVIARQTPALWHDSSEVAERAAALSEELHEPVAPGFGVLVSKSLRHGVDSREWTFIRKDGSRFPGNLTVTTLRDRRGLTTGYLGFVEDITERRQQQQALKASAEQMRLLVENAPSAVAMLDHELKYILASRRWIEDYQLQGQQVIGRSHYELFPEIQQMSEWLDIHQRALGGEVFDRREDSWVRQDGRQEWIEWAIHPWIDRGGRVGGIVMFTEVITGRKLAEQALRTSEETFRTALQFAPIGQVLIAPDGRWLKVNPALSRLLGYSEEELLAGSLQWLTESESEDSAQMVRKLQSGQVQECQLEKVFQRRDGRVISMLLSISLVRRADSQPDYLIAQVQDITERKEMERLKNEFISVVSHELRTPLTSIRGSLGLLLGVFKQELPQKVKSLIEIAYNNCERLIPLINDILDIDKIASGHMRFEMREESVAQLTMQAVQANEAYARRFNVSIAVARIDESLRVLVDAARYQQVLSNLLSNASKFSPAGGVVEVSAEASGGKVSIAVRDYGEGISEEFQSRIFGKFSQADSSATRVKGGTGLGLHIAKQLAERMHGRIEFSTQVGEGTTFRLEFPLVTKAAPHDPSEVLHFRERRQPGADVLHIEDDVDLGNLVATALQGKATTFTATTIAEAESLLAKKSFAMILLDMKLPDGTGVELLERMRALGEPSPPVVILAADEPPLDVSRNAAAVMVKTRTSEAIVVNTVLEILQQVKDEKEPPAPIATSAP